MALLVEVAGVSVRRVPIRALNSGSGSGRGDIRGERFFEGRLDLQLDGGRAGGGGQRGIGQRLPREAGGDRDRARGLGDGHLFKVRIAKRLKEAERGRAELAGQLPFLLAAFPGAAGPVGGEFAGDSDPGSDLLLKEARLKIGNPLEPAMAPGPFFDGGKMLPQLIGHGRQGAVMAQLKENLERAKGARRFTGIAFEKHRRRGGLRFVPGQRSRVTRQRPGSVTKGRDSKFRLGIHGHDFGGFTADEAQETANAGQNKNRVARAGRPTKSARQ